MSTITGSIHVPVPRVESLSERDVEILIGDDSALLDNISDVFLQGSTCAFRSTLLPWGLAVDEMMKTASLTYIGSELMAYKFVALIGYQKFRPAIVLYPSSGKRTFS